MLPGKTYTLADLIYIPFRHRWLVILPTAVLAIAASAWAPFVPHKYQSDAIVLIAPQRLPDPSTSLHVVLPIDERVRAVRERLLRRETLERLIEEFDLYAAERSKKSLDVAVELMRESIVTRVVRDNAFSVGFVASDPAIAQRVTERLAGLLDEQTANGPASPEANTNQFLETELNAASEHVIEQEQKLQEYRRSFASELPDQVGPNLRAMQNATNQLQNLEDLLRNDRARRAVAERQLADAGTKGLPPDAQEPLSGARATTSPAQSLEEIDRAIADNEADARRLRAVVASHRAKIEAASTRATELFSLTRDYEEAQRQYQDALMKVETSKAAVNPERQQSDAQFKVLDQPTIPDRPLAPKRPLMAGAGAAVGFALGLALAFLVELRDRTLRSAADVLTACGVPVVATLTTIRPAKRPSPARASP